MMTTLDRYFLVGFVRNFLIMLFSLLGLYVVVDLFMNLNDFTKGKSGVLSIAQHVFGYYSAQVSLIFDRLDKLIVLAAAMFTVSWMQRNNELLPQLSAGVPTRRVIRPVLLGVIVTSFLAPLNSEFYIPRVAEQLTVSRDDADFRKPMQVRGAFDPNTKEHITASTAVRASRTPEALASGAIRIEDYATLLNFEYTSSSERGSEMLHLSAAKAVYIPAGAKGEKLSGGWKLFGATPVEPQKIYVTKEGSTGDQRVNEERWKIPDNVVFLGQGQYFVKTTELDFDGVTRRHTWHQFADTNSLWEALNKGTSAKQQLAVQFHLRLTRPLTSIILVFLGLSVILRDQNRHVFISAGLCLGTAALFYAFVEGAKYLGDQELVPAVLAAWLPVLVFAPIAFVQFDAIHT